METVDRALQSDRFMVVYRILETPRPDHAAKINLC
jgi:hypothetical protein